MKKRKILLKTATGIVATIGISGIGTSTTSCSTTNPKQQPFGGDYDITPESISGVDNIVNWTATSKDKEGLIISKKSGQLTLTEDINEWKVDFDGEIHTFAVNWKYTPINIEYDITPINYEGSNHIVNWTTSKNPDGPDNNIEISGTTDLLETGNITSLNVDFPDGTNHLFTNINWKYIPASIRYEIYPINTKSNGEVSWTATKYVNNKVEEIKQDTYLTKTNEYKTSLLVKFDSDSQPYEFNNIHWVIEQPLPPDSEYSITPIFYESSDNVVQWIATKRLGSDTLTESGEVTLNNDIFKFKVEFKYGNIVVDTHEYDVFWLKYIEPKSEYSINPVFYDSIENKVNWTATKKVEDQILTKSGEVILTNDIFKWNVTFDDGTSHEFNVAWLYSPEDTLHWITPAYYESKNNEVAYTAYKYFNDTIISTSGSYKYDEDVTSFKVTFDDGEEYIYHVNWIYVPIHIEYNITPIQYEGIDNKVNWTATMEIDDNNNIVEVSGTQVLSETINSFTIDFNNGYTHTFTVNWIYIAPVIKYDISPLNIIVRDNKVDWTANKYVNNNIVKTISGTTTLVEGEQINHFEVNFLDGELSHLFEVDWKQASNLIVLTNGQQVTIHNLRGLLLMNSTMLDRLNNTKYTSAPIASVEDIESIYINDTESNDTWSGDYYGSWLCYRMKNLVKADIKLNPRITKVGVNFCNALFNGCVNLTELNDDFNIPQGIDGYMSTISDADGNRFNQFCEGIFYNCTKLTTLPSNFCMPQNITGNVKNYFEASMFTNCESLVKLPNGFKLSTKITGNLTDGHGIMQNLFTGCKSLLGLPSSMSYVAPSGATSGSLPYLTGDGWSYNFSAMFDGCESMYVGSSVWTDNDGSIFFKYPGTAANWTNMNYVFRSVKIKNGTVPVSPTIQQLQTGYYITCTDNV